MELSKALKEYFKGIRIKDVLLLVLGGMIVAFGIYNIHDVSDVTEGGIFGFDLLLRHHFGISPGITNFVLTAVCFLIGRKALGKRFIGCSVISASAFSLFYFLFERTPRLFPEIAGYPLIAALSGAVFVGVGAGLSVAAGGAQSGDDALAMAFNKFFGWKISAVYLVSDSIVLLLSLTYIPLEKILYSLLTVVLSGQIIEIVVRVYKKRSSDKSEPD